MGGNHFLLCLEKIAHPPHPAIFKFFPPPECRRARKAAFTPTLPVVSGKSVRVQINISLYELTFKYFTPLRVLDMMFCK